jgi:hypothetical protein
MQSELNFDKIEFATTTSKGFAMHAQQFLHKLLKKALSGIHLLRVESLITLAEGLLWGSQLTVTDLGRHIRGPAKTKHKIKRADRLLSNSKLLAQRRIIYQALCGYFFRTLKRLEILVDWSGCCSKERHILQASLVYQGRAIPIYQELHSKKKQHNPDVHNRFLDRLKQIIPSDREIVIVTDAGFQTPWFKKVRSLGWHFVGRLYSHTKFRLPGREDWQPVGGIEFEADGYPRSLGWVSVGATLKEAVECCIVVCKEPKKGRKKYRRYGPIFPNQERAYRQGARRPWVLVTSEEDSVQRARITKNIYRRRMQIEQNFRDEKNIRWGMGLRFSRTRRIKRLEILLLIGLIGQYLIWLMGMTAEFKRIQWEFCAHSKKDRRILSLMTLAKQIVYQGFDRLKPKDFRESLQHFYDSYAEEVLC